MSAHCDYANARISARRALLLGPAGLREVATRPALEAQVEVLRRSLWGRALAQEHADALGRDAVQPRAFPLHAEETAVVAGVAGQDVEAFAHWGTDPAEASAACARVATRMVRGRPRGLGCGDSPPAWPPSVPAPGGRSASGL